MELSTKVAMSSQQRFDRAKEKQKANRQFHHSASPRTYISRGSTEIPKTTPATLLSSIVPNLNLEHDSDSATVKLPPRTWRLDTRVTTASTEGTPMVLPPITSEQTLRVQRKAHFEEQKVYRIYTCLLTALAVDQPADARAYLKEKIIELQKIGTVSWDVLVPVESRPVKPVVPYWLAVEEPWDDYRPTKDMCVHSNHFNKKRLLKLGLNLWRKGVALRREQLLQVVRKMMIVTHQRKLQVCGTLFRAWAEHTRQCVEQRRLGFLELERRTTSRMQENIFRAWLKHTRKSIETRLWLERMTARGVEEEDSVAQESDMFSLKLDWSCRVNVFLFLGVLEICRCAQVCRSWQDVTQDPAVWARIDFSPVASRTTDDVVGRISHRFQTTMTNVSMKDCRLLSYEGCLRLGECRNLQELNLGGCRYLPDAGVREIVQGCKSLIFLNLSSTCVTDLALLYLATYSIHLQYLSLAFCENLTDAGALSLATGSGCRNLFHLDLSGCRNFSTEGFVHVIRACGANLEELQLRSLPTLRDVVLFSVSQICTNLKTIGLQGSHRINDRAVKSLGRCVKLSTISMTHNPHITGQSIKALTKLCKDISVVNLVGCRTISKEGYGGLSQCPVTSLNVSEIPALSDSCLRALAEGSQARKTLEFLDTSQCTSLTEIGFQAVARFTNLTHLIMRDCPGLTDSAFERLADMQELTNLDVCGCVNFGDDGLAMFGSIARDNSFNGVPRPSLQHVDFTNCVEIGDDGLGTFAKGCVQLLTLRLSGCVNITDEGITQILISNKYIGLLDLQDCAKITNKTVEYIARACANLASLNLFGLELLTNVAAEKQLLLLRNLSKLALSQGGKISSHAVATLQKIRPRMQIHFGHLPPPYF